MKDKKDTSTQFQHPKSEKKVNTTHLTNKYMTVHVPDLIQALQ
jgi:hypothetical protein